MLRCILHFITIISGHVMFRYNFTMNKELAYKLIHILDRLHIIRVNNVICLQWILHQHFIIFLWFTILGFSTYKIAQIKIILGSREIFTYHMIPQKCTTTFYYGTLHSIYLDQYNHEQCTIQIFFTHSIFDFSKPRG